MVAWWGISRVVAAALVVTLVAGLSTASGAVRPERRGRIVFQTQRYELAIVNPDGTGFRKLTRPLRDLSNPEWSPNGQLIVFELRRLRPPRPPAPERVWVIGADGRGLRQVARGMWPRWAPDGRRLVFVDQAGSTDTARVDSLLRWGRITVLNLATGRRTVIGRGTMPDWSPDGKRVAFVRYSFMSSDFGLSYDPVNSALFTVASDGSDVRQVYSGSYALPFSDSLVLYWPTWSPDSRKVAAYGQVIDGTNALVLLTDVSDSPVRILVKDVPAEGSPVAWSPDGTRLAFTSRGPSGFPPYSIETVDVVAKVRKRVARSVERAFDWSPDGHQIAFVRCAVTESRCDLRTVALADGRTRVLRPVLAYTSLDWG